MAARRADPQHTTDTANAGSETTKLNISAIDAAAADELRGFVRWLMSHGGRDGMQSYGDVIERAWKSTAKHYRRRLNGGKKFAPAQSLPPGRKAKTVRSEDETVEYTRLTISGIRVDVANELRGMVWALMQRSQRDGLNSLGDVIGDMLGRYLPEAAEKYNGGRPFGSAQQLPPGRKR